jgi:hypothetical protein
VPLWNLEVLPQSFNVRRKMVGRVLTKVGGRRRFSASTLVEKNDAVHGGIEERCVLDRCLPSWTAVEKDHYGLVADGYGKLEYFERKSYLAFHPVYHTARTRACGWRLPEGHRNHTPLCAYILRLTFLW